MVLDVLIAKMFPGHGEDDASKSSATQLRSAWEAAEQEITEKQLESDVSYKLDINIGEAGGNVLINFGRPTQFLSMDPHNARRFSEMVRKQSHRLEIKALEKRKVKRGRSS